MKFSQMVSVGFFGMGVAAVAAQAGEVRLAGTIFSDYRTGLTRLDLKAKAGGLATYRMKGQVLAERLSLLGKVKLSYDAVEVTKEMESAAGGFQVSTYANQGVLIRFPFDREIRGELKLAGLPLSGGYRVAAVDSGIEWSGLVFDGERSRGRLDYSSWNGYYRPEGGLMLGAYRMRSGAGSKFMFNLDHYLGQNVLQTDFEFGGLRVRGTVQYSDTIESHEVCSTDSDGDESCSTVEDVVARTGNYNWKIQSSDGAALQISDSPDRAGADDAQLRALLAWLELVSYDLR